MGSDTLTWLVTKKTSSFRVKRDKAEFSAEPFNLMNRNCEKFSGFSAVKGADIALKDGKINLTTKKVKHPQQPAKARHVVPLRKGARAGAKTIDANIAKNHYRADLRSAALARWSRLSTVSKIEKGVLKKRAIRSRRVKA